MALVSTSAAGRRGGFAAQRRRTAVVAWLFALPFLVIFAVFMLGPLLGSFAMSFTDLGVRDLIEAGDRRARVGAALSERARMRAGAELHRERQAAREADVAAEVTLRHAVVVRGWTCTVHGRADLVAEEEGRTVVEEIKSTLLDGDGLAEVPSDDDPLYLFMFNMDDYPHGACFRQL